MSRGEDYLVFRIPGKTSEAVPEAMKSRHDEYQGRFSGFAHPYTSWDHLHNKRHSGLFRAFVPTSHPLRSTAARIS